MTEPIIQPPYAGEIESHESMADSAASRVSTFRSYHDFCTDPALLAYADAMAEAAQVEHDAHTAYAAALRARVSA